MLPVDIPQMNASRRPASWRILLIISTDLVCGQGTAAYNGQKQIETTCVRRTTDSS